MVNLFPYEIGVGGLVAVTGAFLLGRMCRLPMSGRTRGKTGQPTSASKSSNPSKTTNPIQRLDELEILMKLGVLTREEFETEKEKLRNSI